MEKRIIKAQDLIDQGDIFHLAKEFYRYITRYPELENEDKWKAVKKATEDFIVQEMWNGDSDGKQDPDWYREFLQFYTSLEMKDYGEEREFIFTKESIDYILKKTKVN